MYPFKFEGASGGFKIVCGDCGHSASRRDNFIRHRKSVHQEMITPQSAFLGVRFSPEFRAAKASHHALALYRNNVRERIRKDYILERIVDVKNPPNLDVMRVLDGHIEREVLRIVEERASSKSDAIK